MRKETVGRRRWRAGIAGGLVLAALVAFLALATSAGGSNRRYTVRAIFDDAGNLIPGEDVKIDGVKVGTVGSVTPTPQAKAAVVLNISNPGFQDFRTRRQLHDPPAGADRREVRRLRAHPAARGRHAAAPAAAEDPVSGTKARASTCCRSRTPTARSTSTCSATSAGCPNASA